MRFKMGQAGRITAFLAGTAIAAVCASTAARAEIVGTLQCNVAGSVGAIITSTRALSCTFQSAAGPIQLYNGTFSRLGVDLGTLTSGTLTYQVLALGVPGPGDLQGNYIGTGASVTLGSGIGVEGLIGGNGNSVTLQPLATTISTGANINAGLGALRLTFAGVPRPPRMRHHYHRHHRMHHHHM